jgi:hypothetical protein
MDETDCVPGRRFWFSRFIFFSSSGDRSWDEDILCGVFPASTDDQRRSCRPVPGLY